MGTEEVRAYYYASAGSNSAGDLPGHVVVPARARTQCRLSWLTLLDFEGLVLGWIDKQITSFLVNYLLDFISTILEEIRRIPQIAAPGTAYDRRALDRLRKRDVTTVLIFQII